MRIKLQQNEKIKEVEVTITYDKMSERLKHMIRGMKQYGYELDCTYEKKQYYLPLEQLIYVEYVDGHAFLYAKDKVYESTKSLTSIEQDLENTTLIRISKTTLMNVAYLAWVKPYPNHRLLAELKNGEKLIVSRKYIKSLKEVVRRSYGETDH